MKKWVWLLWLLWLFIASPAIAGQATLSWDPPTTNTDGTSLNDLGGYKAYYGTASGVYGSVIDVGNVVTYTVSNLSNGTYYFVVTAYDTSGNESAYSNEVSKIIASTPVPAPAALQAIGSGGTVTLSWDKPNHTDIAGYQISRGLSTGLYNTFYDIGAAQTASASCVISYTGCVRKQHIWYNTPPGTYYFTVRGYDSQGAAGSYSGEASVTLSTDAVLPADVTSFSATKLTDTSIRLTWTNPSDPDFGGLKIEYAFNSTTNYILLASLKGYPGAQQAYNHYNLIPGAYNYKIHTYDKSGNMTNTEHASTTLADKVVQGAAPPASTQTAPAPTQKREKTSSFGCGTITNTKPPDDRGNPDASVLALVAILLFLIAQKNKRERKMKRYLAAIFVLAMFLFGRDAMAGQATISWEYPERMAIKGFKLYIVSIDNQYTESYYIDSGNTADTEKNKSRALTLYGLVPGTYHFWTTAIYHDKDIESVPSKLQKISVPNIPDPVDLKIIQTDTDFLLSWTTPLLSGLALQDLAHRIGINDYSPGYYMQLYDTRVFQVQPRAQYVIYGKIDPINDPYYHTHWVQPNAVRLFFKDSNEDLIGIAETTLFIKQYCE